MAGHKVIMKNKFDLVKFFLYIVKFTYAELNDYLFTALQAFYKEEDIIWHKEDEKSFIYVKGTQPYMLVAHTDTVHKQRPKDIFFTKNIDDPLFTSYSSPQGIGGDDRAGIAIIFALLSAGLRPSLLFPSGEEIGTKGSTRFTELNPDLLNVNFILQFDRRHNTDVTRYADDNDSLIKQIIPLGYTEVHGSFSDISILCPKYRISGVNVSASFFNEHTFNEYVDVGGMLKTVETFTKFLQSDAIYTKHIYIPKTYVSTGYQQTSLFDNEDAFVASYTKYKPMDNPSLLKTNSYVDDYSKRACFNCSQYSDHFIDIKGSIYCEDCVDQIQYDCVCPHCSDFLFLEDSVEVQFDFIFEELYLVCPSCGVPMKTDGIIPQDTIDNMMSVLISKGGPKKGGKK